MTEAPSSSVTRWARFRDFVAGPVVVLAAGAVFSAHGFVGALDRDLAIYTYAGQRVAAGVPPYVGLVNRSGPLSHLVPGLGIWLGRLVDAQDVISARVLFLIISVAAVYVAYRLGRSLLGSSVLGASVGLTLVSVQGFVDYASRGPREKTLMVLLLLLVLYAVLLRRWLAVGAAISLATLTWQPVFFPATAVAVVALVLDRRGRRWRGLLRLAVGGLVPAGVVVGWYAAIGQLPAFVDCFVLINAKYTRQYGPMHNPGLYWEQLRSAYGPTLWVLFLGLSASLVAGVVASVRLTRRRDAVTPDRQASDAFLVATGVGTVVALAWTARAYNGWPDAYLLFPFAVTGIASVLALVRRVSSPRVANVVAVAWAAASVALGATYAVDSRGEGLLAQEAQTRAVLDVLGSDATMMSLQAPAPLVLAGKVDPIRYQMFSLGLENYVDDVWPGGLEGLGEDILRERPTVLVVSGAFRPDWVQHVLDEGYARVGYDDVGHYAWFVSREVPRDTRLSVRESLTSLSE